MIERLGRNSAAGSTTGERERRLVWATVWSMEHGREARDETGDQGGPSRRKLV